MSAPTLHPYQHDVLERLKKEIAGGRCRICLVAPTGSGKTVIAAAIIADAVARGDRVVSVAHRRELTDQTSQKLHAVGVDHGIIQVGFPTRPGERIQVASIQTLHGRAVRTCKINLPLADLLFIDEAHHARARTYHRLIESYPKAVIIGLTATPCRRDGRGLENTFDALVECPSVAELTKNGYLDAPSLEARQDGFALLERSRAVEMLGQHTRSPELVADVHRIRDVDSGDHASPVFTQSMPMLDDVADQARGVHARGKPRFDVIAALDPDTRKIRSHWREDSDRHVAQIGCVAASGCRGHPF
jgi:DNA repair protein RadD